MRNRRFAWLLAAVALAGSQAGHLVAYGLRFGAASFQIEASGAHSYFPSLVKTGFGFAGLALLAALLVVGAGRMAGRRRLDVAASPSLLRVLAVLYSLQLVCFVLQETAEAMLGGSRLNSAATLLLWGAAGQLPVALIAALALRWLGTRFAPALAAIRSQIKPVRQRPVFAFAAPSLPPATDVVTVSQGIAFSVTRRGPPSS
ncbi:MAG TPA: hypothetical protein VGK28_00215 [Candidatus Dormibacteraeota bacterium]